jgi:hypothetical protein
MIDLLGFVRDIAINILKNEILNEERKPNLEKIKYNVSNHSQKLAFTL